MVSYDAVNRKHKSQFVYAEMICSPNRLSLQISSCCTWNGTESSSFPLVADEHLENTLVVIIPLSKYFLITYTNTNAGQGHTGTADRSGLGVHCL